MGRVGLSWVVNPSVPPLHEDDENVLFIGNSYTGYNRLPKLVQAALEEARKSEPASSSSIVKATRKVNVASHTPPGETFVGHRKALENGHLFRRFSFDFYYLGNHLQRCLIPGKDHAATTITATAAADAGDNVQQRQWNWITLQNHSIQAGFFASSDPKIKSIFNESLEAAKAINNIIVEHHVNAKTIFVLTWGRPGKHQGYPDLYPSFLTMQQLLLEGCQKYVEATSAPARPTYLAPVGLVFRTIYQDCCGSINANAGGGGEHSDVDDTTNDPTRPPSLFYDLYDKGDHHPSLAGSYVYALTVVATMTGKNVVRDLNAWVPIGLDAEVAKKLREAVQRTIEQTVREKIIRYPWQD